ncbi:MAG: hypothetical protein M3163_01490, partial [Actinomycetota bacterium]|nr:hypothetical protein [Actinomycetota bacterium]
MAVICFDSAGTDQRLAKEHVMKTATHISSNIGDDELDRADAWTVGAPVSTGWQEATLTRANELEELSKALAPSAGSANGNGPLDTQVVLRAID